MYAATLGEVVHLKDAAAIRREREAQQGSFISRLTPLQLWGGVAVVGIGVVLIATRKKK